jgi:pyruvate/2-oxoglutarate dehydrogenase complex dihydrolipoamide acyltransferase (E2) component
MAYPVQAPRLNNNDDTVRVGTLLANIGGFVRKGDPILEVETSKALYVMEAEEEGFLLQSLHPAGEEVPVGTVLLWMGASPDEAVPEAEAPAAGAAPGEAGAAVEITGKAKLLLAQHGFSPEVIPHAGGRITAADVEAYLAGREQAAAAPAEERPPVQGEFHPLPPEARGMLGTVLWHRDQAVPAYLEIQYDPAPWDAYALEFLKANRLMATPLIALMGRCLAALVVETPKLNGTVIGNRVYQYGTVNLGLTVQAGEALYLVVIRDAARLTEIEFVQTFSGLQRKAAARSLTLEQTTGATAGFSSMARWPVGRHIPILPPYCSLMIAHAAPKGGPAVLGATYDHRLLNGFDVVKTLEALARPPARKT